MRSGHISPDRVGSKNALSTAIRRHIDNSCADGISGRAQCRPYTIESNVARSPNQSIQCTGDLALAISLDPAKTDDLARGNLKRNITKLTRTREIIHLHSIWARFIALRRKS